MNTVYQQRRNLELALDRFNWAAAKQSDQIPQSEELKTPAKASHTEAKLATNNPTDSHPSHKHQHQLELVPARKRFKQCGGAGPSPSKAATNFAGKGNPSQQRKGGDGNGRDAGGGAGPSRNAAGGGNNEDSGNDDDVFDPADDDAPKAVDSQCAQCDDGGFLIECICRCRRAFHVGIEPEEEAGGSAAFEDDSDEEEKKNDDKAYITIDCNVINMEEDLAIALATSSSQLVCPSCLVYEQRCYCCGKSDEEGTKVRPCLVASCGHFYHPACMKEAKKQLGLNHAARSLREMCPLHWCCKCKQQGDGGGGGGEDDEENDQNNNELVQCRRCPVAYHRGCIPSSWNGLEGAPQRAWMADFDADGHLLPGCTVETSMLYCTKHELDEQGVAKHTVPLFSNDMLKSWVLHYAKEFPHLESSKKLLKEKGVLGIVRESPALAGGGALGISSGSGSGAALKRHSLANNQASAPPVSEGIRALDASAMRATTELDAVLDARRMLDEAKNQIDIGSVKAGMMQPYPYRNRSKNTIDMGVLANLEATMQYVDGNTSAEGPILTTLVRKADIQAIDESYRFLSYYMSPYIYPATYYSFGRIFMKKDLIKHVVGRLSHLLRNRDCIVDLNCGKNEFVPLVKEVARKDGLVVTGRSYDVIVPKDLVNYVRKPWKAVTPESDNLRDGDRLVIGVKPPHGKGIRLANAFIDHIATFSARLLVVVVPVESIIPRGYSVVLEDRNICNVRDSFYDPSTNRPLLQAEAGDHVLRVLVRADLEHSVFEAGKSWKEVPVAGRR